MQCACIVRGGEVLASSFPESDAVAQAASLGFVRGINDGLELVDRGLDELLIDFGGRSLLVAPVDKDFVLALLAAPDANTQLLRVVMGSSARQLRRMNDIAEKPEPAKAAPPRPQQAAPAPPPAPQASSAPRPQATGRPQPPQTKPAPPPPPPLKGQQPPARPQTTPAPQQPGRPVPQAPQAAKQATPPPPPPPAAKAADKDAEPVLPQVLALLTEYIGPVARVSFKRGVARWRETGTPTIGTLGQLAKILAADLSSDAEKKAFLDAVEKLRKG